jgi:hypothetical protein
MPCHPLSLMPAHIVCGVLGSGVVARADVNYHFNWGTAPVVPKY